MKDFLLFFGGCIVGFLFAVFLAYWIEFWKQQREDEEKAIRNYAAELRKGE